MAKNARTSVQMLEQFYLSDLAPQMGVRNLSVDEYKPLRETCKTLAEREKVERVGKGLLKEESLSLEQYVVCGDLRFHHLHGELVSETERMEAIPFAVITHTLRIKRI